jgi:hypothetical protein
MLYLQNELLSCSHNFIHQKVFTNLVISSVLLNWQYIDTNIGVIAIISKSKHVPNTMYVSMRNKCLKKYNYDLFYIYK